MLAEKEFSSLQELMVPFLHGVLIRFLLTIAEWKIQVFKMIRRRSHNILTTYVRIHHGSLVEQPHASSICQILSKLQQAHTRRELNYGNSAQKTTKSKWKQKTEQLLRWDLSRTRNRRRRRVALPSRTSTR